ATIAAANRFHAGMAAARDRGATIYGECGGYMALGEGLVDAAGKRHAMLGLLALETSFEQRKLHLGYRRISAEAGLPLGKVLSGHEFHYSSPLRETGAPLFSARDALGADLGPCGLRAGRVMGSYLHVIDGVGNG
ncbi:MAG: cobyrinic acid a,c-diamide synthase, partial [Nitratireductor sp.]|nr:cobyrinic acid a,c-diamide synthase [Nitratireductor sp.]